MQLFTLNPEEFRELKEQISELTETVKSITPAKTIYDPQDVMQLLNICKRTLDNWRENGTLRYSKVGGKLYFFPEDIQEMLNKGMCNVNPKRHGV